MCFCIFLQFTSPPHVQQPNFDSSPVFVRQCSLNDYEDDGFLDVLDDDMEVRASYLI